VIFLFAHCFVSHEWILYSGRLDKLLYVPLPNAEERACILNALAGKIKLAREVDLNEIGKCHRANGYSGADCAALLREAGLAVLKENLNSPIEQRQVHISARHFDYAFHHVLPSVSTKDQARYDRMRDRMARARTRAGGVADPPLETIKQEGGPAEDVPMTS
jgi:ribosome biogenesis ATPase